MAKKSAYKFGFLSGVKGGRKTRSPWFSDEFSRNMHASATKAAGYRVRKYRKKVI